MTETATALAPVVEPGAVEAITRGEIDIQITTAKRYPRSVKAFLHDALNMATLDVDTAQACFYALPRDGKRISGPSARLAEIVASAWGHMRVEGRVIEIGTEFVTARGTAWDLERNMAMAVEVRRRITTKAGRRYSDDMIGVTANAAIAIAVRNAVFKVVPSAYTRAIYGRCLDVAAGDARTLVARRERALKRFADLGVSEERVLATLQVRGIDDIGLDELVTLTGVLTAIRDGDTTPEEAFAAPEVQQPQRRSTASAAEATQGQTDTPTADTPTTDQRAQADGAPEPETRPQEAAPEPTALISAAQQRQIFRVGLKHGWRREDVSAYLRAAGFDGVRAVTVETLPDILNGLQQPRERQPGDEG